MPIAGVCAAACLWCAVESLSHRFGLKKFSYNIIGHLAEYSETKETAIPRKDIVFSSGLTPRQICNAISETGATPEYFDVEHLEDPSAARMLVYTTIESCLPVILCYQKTTKSCSYNCWAFYS